MNLSSNLLVALCLLLYCLDVQAAIKFRTNSTITESDPKQTSCTVPKPAFTEAGDVVIATFQLDRDAQVMPPSDWKSIPAQSSEAVDMKLVAYYKVLADKEPVMYSFALSSPSWCAGGAVAYAGVDPKEPVDVWGSSFDVTPLMPAAPLVPLGPKSWLVIVWAVWNGHGAIILPKSMTTRISLDKAEPVLVADEAIPLAGKSTGIRIANAFVPAAWVSLSFMLRPASPRSP